MSAPADEPEAAQALVALARRNGAPGELVQKLERRAVLVAGAARRRDALQSPEERPEPAWAPEADEAHANAPAGSQGPSHVDEEETLNGQTKAPAPNAPETERPSSSRRRRSERAYGTKKRCSRCRKPVNVGPVAQARHAETCPSDEIRQDEKRDVTASDVSLNGQELHAPSATPEKILGACRALLGQLAPEARPLVARLLAVSCES